MKKVIIVCKICHRQWEGETLTKDSSPIVYVKCNDCVWKEWIKKGLLTPAKKNYD